MRNTCGNEEPAFQALFFLTISQAYVFQSASSFALGLGFKMT